MKYQQRLRNKRKTIGKHKDRELKERLQKKICITNDLRNDTKLLKTTTYEILRLPMNTEIGRKIKEVKGKTNNPWQQTKTAVERQCRKQGHSGKPST